MRLTVLFLQVPSIPFSVRQQLTIKALQFWCLTNITLLQNDSQKQSNASIMKQQNQEMTPTTEKTVNKKLKLISEAANRDTGDS